MRATRVLVLLMLLGAGIIPGLDFDGDGLATASEWANGTPWLDGDGDNDGASDGWERRAGSNPNLADTDGDGLHDGADARRGGSPVLADTDGDGIMDGDESDVDCDGDGISAVGSSDDDADGLIDGLEWLQSTCIADADKDGLLDGAEGNLRCVMMIDCDLDGLLDGDEAPDYSPLDPDTYDAGLTDAVVRAFAVAGQEPSADADHDGIPDAWEARDGLISWGAFSPTAGNRDLLVEYIRVQGPHSTPAAALDFTPSYDAVSLMFGRERGITLQWVETVVTLDSAYRPDFLSLDEAAYYGAVLEASTSAQNPFVTSIVLNPQQVQEDLAGDILGAAFLRSMVATVDYGAHTQVRLVEDSADGLFLEGGELWMSPVIESHIIGARLEQVRQLQRSGQVDEMRVLANGDLLLDLGDQKWTWTPNWFMDGPNITTDTGWIKLRRTTATIDESALASTIAHELGHTLGLCHAHETACAAEFSSADQANAATSTMSYQAPRGALHFLTSEWEQLDAYITCAPQEPIALIASGADPSAVMEAKYFRSFVEAVELRSCGDLTALTVDIPAHQATHYEATPPVAGRSGVPVFIGYILAVSAIGFGFWKWQQMRFSA